MASQVGDEDGALNPLVTAPGYFGIECGRAAERAPVSLETVDSEWLRPLCPLSLFEACYDSQTLVIGEVVAVQTDVECARPGPRS